MDKYSIIVKKLQETTSLIADAENREEIINNLICDGHLNIFGITPNDIDHSVSSETIEKLIKIDHEVLLVTILTEFLNTLVEHDELTSTAFMHRCYLDYAKIHHKTNSRLNVIQKVDKFKDVMRGVFGEYEVKEGGGRSKGWRLGIPK